MTNKSKAQMTSKSKAQMTSKSMAQQNLSQSLDNQSQLLDSQVNYWTTKSSNKRAQVQGPFNNPRKPSSYKTLEEEEDDFSYKYSSISSFRETEKFSQETSSSRQ